MRKQTWKAVVSAAAIAAGAAIPMAANAGTPITNIIDGVEWRFMLDYPSAGKAMIGINTSTSSNTGRDNDALHGCPVATSVNAGNIPWEFDYNDVHYTVTIVAQGAFYNNVKLTGILTIPPTVTELRNNAFQLCSGLTGLRGGDSVTFWGTSALNSCLNMAGVYPDFSAATGTIGETVLYGAPLTGTLKLGNSVTAFARYAFRNCFFSGAAVIPANVNTIGTDTNYGVFDTNPNLTSIWVKGKATAASYTTVYCARFAAACTSLKMILMGQNTKGGRMTQTGNNAMLAGDTGVQVFVPANGQWDGLNGKQGGNNNKVWYYGPTNEFNLVVNDNLMKATFTPTTVNAFTNALSWVSMFKEQLDLNPCISVTNTLDLTGVTITEQMVSGVTFDRLMFKVNNQAQLNAILNAFPASAPLSIDPTDITENLTVPAARKIHVMLSEADAVRLKVKGLVIIVK